MNILLYRLARVLKIIPLKALISCTGQKNIFPFYHLVSDEDVIHIKHLYKIRTIQTFEKDLDYLLQHYTPIDFNSFKTQLANRQTTKSNTFLLTFDDGLREFYDTAAPILMRKGIPALCFLNSSFIDNKDLFYRYKASILIEKLFNSRLPNSLLKKANEWLREKGFQRTVSTQTLYLINYTNRHYLDELAKIMEVDFDEYLQQVQPYLSSMQINELIKKGFAFGAHSLDHPQFSELNEKEHLHQIKQSIAEVTNTFQLNYKTFSFPFTDSGVSKKLFDSIYDEKAKIADITFGCAGLKKDSCANNIQRIPMEIKNFSASQILYAEYLYYMLKTLVFKNTVIRK